MCQFCHQHGDGENWHLEAKNCSEDLLADPRHCYGCGVCRAACRRQAIRLVDRRSVPAAAKPW